MKRIKFLLTVTSLLLQAISANCQEIISTDRPSFSTGTYTVSPTSFILEMGYNLALPVRNKVPTLQSIPISSLRYGIANNLEISLGWSGMQFSSAENEVKFSNNLALGGKFSAIEKEDYNISILAQIVLEDIDNNIGINPILGLLWDYKLSNALAAFGVVHIAYSDTPKLYNELAIGLNYAATEKLTLFGEYYNSINYKSSSIAHNSMVGGNFLLNNSTQVDCYISSPINDTNYISVGIGFSKLF